MMRPQSTKHSGIALQVTTDRAWKSVLARLRDENEGHYYCPVFRR